MEVCQTEELYLLTFPSSMCFSQDLHILNALYEILMSTSEMQNGEAVIYMKLIKFCVLRILDLCTVLHLDGAGG